MKQGVLIYGCYGYTGRLISEEAKHKGLPVTLAGRDEQRVKQLAQELQLPYRVFSLDHAVTVEENIKDFIVVIHCAGPFIHTAVPMVNACLNTATHYLDISGEYQVFEEIFKRDTEALAAKILLMPGVGFDVVPSDCLATFLKEELPTGTELELALYMKGGRLSHGTAKTIVENLGEQCVVRRGGQLTSIANGSLSRSIYFDKQGKRTAVAISWGDISSAYRSTGIQNITVYNVVHPSVISTMKWTNPFSFVFRWGFIKNYLKKRIEQKPAGPNEQERLSANSYIWGKLKNPLGVSKNALLELPEGYSLTSITAVRIAQRILQGDIPFGAQTPSQVFGHDFILEFEGVKRKMLN